MTSTPTRLRGSLLQLQRATAKYYSQLHGRFGANSLVRECWGAMERDMQSQAESLKKLPASFWHALKKQEKALAQAAGTTLRLAAGNNAGTLSACLRHTLDLEEPMIIEVYAPLIRRLRTQVTVHALDFYIVVKAHIARLTRIVQTYAGDPDLCRRCDVLMANLEKKTQESDGSDPVAAAAAKRKSKSRNKKRSAAARRRTVERAATRARRKLPKRAKPLVKKIEIARRRARQ